MASNEKGKPRKNFSSAEIQTLLNCVEQYKHILENKLTNATVNQQKHDAWCAIERDFNSIIGSNRTSTQLLQLYKNLKRRNKQKSLDQLDVSHTNKQVSENKLTLNDKILAAVNLSTESSSDSNKCYFLVSTSDTPSNNQDNEELVEFVVPTTEPISNVKLVSVNCNAPISAKESRNPSASPIVVSVKSNASNPNSNPKVVHSSDLSSKDTNVKLSRINKRNLLYNNVSKRQKSSEHPDSIYVDKPLDNQARLKEELLREEHKQAMEHREQEHQLKIKILEEKMKIMSEKVKFWQKMHERLSKTDIVELNDKQN